MKHRKNLAIDFESMWRKIAGHKKRADSPCRAVQFIDTVEHKAGDPSYRDIDRIYDARHAANMARGQDSFAGTRTDHSTQWPNSQRPALRKKS